MTTRAITVTNTSPGGCDITATLGAVTGTGTLTLTSATSTQTPTVEGGSPELNNAATVGVSCTQALTSVFSEELPSSSAVIIDAVTVPSDSIWDKERLGSGVIRLCPG